MTLAGAVTPLVGARAARRRVLFVITTSDVGGTESFLHTLVLGLDRTAFEPIVCSLCPTGRAAASLAAAGVELHALEMSDPPRLSEFGRATLRLARLIDSLEIDLVQGLLYRANTLGGMAGRLAGRRPVMVAGQRSLTPLRGRPAAFAARVTRRFSDRIVAVSTAVRDELCRSERLDPSRVVVINNGVDTARFCTGDRAAARLRLGLPPDETIVAGVGRLSVEKGFHHLLDAVAHLRRTGCALRLVLAGDGPQRRELAARAENLGLNGAVRFLGTCADPLPLYTAADIFALPSQEEGLPNALLEAMACGRAVVASNVGGVPAVIEHERHGLLVPPQAPEALAESLRRLSDERVLRERLGHAARRRVLDSFGVAAMVDAYADLYRELLDAKDADLAGV